jgi:hypothetical protein
MLAPPLGIMRLPAEPAEPARPELPPVELPPRPAALDWPAVANGSSPSGLWEVEPPQPNAMASARAQLPTPIAVLHPSMTG